LLNDNFSSLVEAVRMGRRVFDNLKKAIAYIISVHTPIAGMSLLPVIFGWPIILYPVHIVFLELIIDPVCSIVFESEQEEADIMSRRPRDPKKSLFGRKLLILSAIQGLFSLLVVVIVFKVAMSHGQTEAASRTLAFITLVVSNVCLILTNRSWSRSVFSTFLIPNRALAYVTAGAVLFLAVVIYNPFFQSLFHFDWMHPEDVIISISAGILSIVWFELVKFIAKKTHIDLMTS